MLNQHKILKTLEDRCKIGLILPIDGLMQELHGSLDVLCILLQRWTILQYFRLSLPSEVIFTLRHHYFHLHFLGYSTDGDPKESLFCSMLSIM